MEKDLYIICSKSEQENVENLLKEPLAEKGFTLITCSVDSDPDTWEEPANAEFVALWLTPNIDAAVYQISARRFNSGKQTINIFPESMFMTADKKRSVGRNQSIFASLHPSGIANVLCSVLPKPQEKVSVPPAPDQAEHQPEVEPDQPLVSVDQEASGKEAKKFPTKIVWIILAVVLALVVLFMIGKEEEEEYAMDMELESAVDNPLLDSQLVDVIQRANNGDFDVLTDAFLMIIAQYNEAPNVVWEGGISKPDASTELLVEQAELGDVLMVKILDQHYSDAHTKAEIVFEYFARTNGYESSHHTAVAYLVNEDENWKICDFGMDATNYDYAPTYFMSMHMSNYITDANQRIQSGETFRDLNHMFSDSPEELEEMKNAVCEYAEKFDVVIPDSLNYYIFQSAE